MDGATMIPEFDQEMATTRRTLERVDADRFDWKPHEKSFSMKELATHLAQLPGWVGITLETDGLDTGQEFPEPEIGSTEDILELFDANVAEARSGLEAASGEKMAEPWTLSMDGEEAFTLPKAVILRTWVLNHNVHHRAQLGVYLRLLDIPVPATYGPSADEEPHG